MANSAKNIRFAPNGTLYLAPAPSGETGGTVLPTSVDESPPGFQALGYVTDTGVTITPSIEVEPQTAWQSAVPVLYTVKSAAFSIKATLRETTALTTRLFFGARWVEVTDGESGPTGVYRLDLSSTPGLDEWSIVVDWEDGDVKTRAVVPRAMISDRGAIQLQRTAAQEYELTIEALDASGQLGYLLSNNEALTAG